jgi:uncharacterized protein (DUF2252 family)
VDADTHERQARIVEVLGTCFADLMAADPPAFRTKFRKMAADPFAFYRGSACLFYADVAGEEDRWADERTSRIWIHGDLHAENFATYMNGAGVLVFDLNDFDEAYVGPFTWDLRRFAASVALLAWTKALPDSDIRRLVEAYLRAYVEHVQWYAGDGRDQEREWALRLDTATGAVRDLLLKARLSSRQHLLDSMTFVDGQDRRFREGSGVRMLDDAERERVEGAFRDYVDTVPEKKRVRSVSFHVKDVVGRAGFGIGSAGLPAYNVLVEGLSQALDNDVVLAMKQGNPAAPARFVDDARVEGAFRHHGHRTALSQRALQAYADPWLGWTELDGVGYVVSELSPYQRELAWDDLADPEEMLPVLEQLGRATAKVHCVSDEDADASEDPLVDFQTEEAIAAAVGEDVDAFVADVADFGMRYGERARADHALFVDAFRNDEIPGVAR